MIGFKADHRRVDYWTNGQTISVEELKNGPFGIRFPMQKEPGLKRPPPEDQLN